MDLYSLVLLSTVSSAIRIICQIMWNAFLMFIQLFGYVLIVTRNSNTIAELEKMASFSTEIDGGEKGGILIGRNICGAIYVKDYYDELRCIVPKSFVKQIFEIDPKHEKDGYYMRIKLSGNRNNVRTDKIIMRSVPEGGKIHAYQQKVLDAVKAGVRAFMICGPPNIGKSSTAGIIAHALSAVLIDNLSPEYWSVRDARRNVGVGKDIILLIDEVDAMLGRLQSKHDVAIKDMYVPTVTSTESWNSWLDAINGSLKKEIILVCTSNMSISDLDEKYGPMVREGRFMRIEAEK